MGTGQYARVERERRFLVRALPEPMMIESRWTTRESMSRGQSSGSPTGVMPPYSIPVRPTASSIDMNEHLRTSTQPGIEAR